MNVEELITELEKVKNKKKKIYLSCRYDSIDYFWVVNETYEVITLGTI